MNLRSRLMTLVVAPLSVVFSWEDHFQDWNPSLVVKVIDRKDRDSFIKSFQNREADVFICHWDALRLMVKQMQDVRWFHIIADEAHRMKNRKAQQTTALKKLPTLHKLALTGTPADNRPDDIWSILNWLYPRTWTSYWSFFRRYVVSNYHTASLAGCSLEDCFMVHKNAYREILGVRNPKEFQREIAPYYIRRLKDDPEVDLELPERLPPQKLWVDLHPQQRRTYNEMRKNMLSWIGRHEDEPIAAPIVVAQLVRLQQFAGAYARLELAKVRTRDGEVVEKQVLRLAEPSSKLDALMELIKDNEEKKFVVFSQSRQLMELFAARMDSSHISYSLFTGNTPQKDRGTLVAKFQSGDSRVFAGTVSAGGVGLTLTAASVVVFTDRHPNPGVNKQAEDRLDRIGQRNHIQVIDLVARDTMDQQRLDQVEMKWTTIKQLLGDK